ncbi:MAG TPA: hypothetical protein VJ761_07865 [Ktedonobacteraceae bacterium]|nr:hypothetical protein [Ktedonobacteraceae bacterium]
MADESAVGAINRPLRGFVTACTKRSPLADQSVPTRLRHRANAVGPDLSRALPIHRPRT